MDSNNIGTSNSALKKSQPPVRQVDSYAAQCENCMKWREIPTQKEYEDIRSEVLENPFVCDRKPGTTCDDEADFEYDSSRTWVLDKPSIPKTPEGFQRMLYMRRDFSKMDAYYVTPTGKRLKTRNAVAAFLEANPEYSVNLSDFNFSLPRVMQDTIPDDIVKKNSPNESGIKRPMTLENTPQNSVTKSSSNGVHKNKIQKL